MPIQIEDAFTGLTPSYRIVAQRIHDYRQDLSPPVINIIVDKASQSLTAEKIAEEFGVNPPTEAELKQLGA